MKNTATLILVFLALVGLACEGDTINNPPPADPDAIDVPCMLPDLLTAAINPQVPVACAGNACIGNVSISLATPPYTFANWQIPGATPASHDGISGEVFYPFTNLTVIHQWSVRACNDEARVCCRNTTGSVRFN